MITGNNIDYNTQYIGMRPDENTRSINELLKEERENGYSNMTDTEISNLIEYKMYQAEHAKKMEMLEEETRARVQTGIDLANKMQEDNRIKIGLMEEPVFKTIEDDGGKRNGKA